MRFHALPVSLSIGEQPQAPQQRRRKCADKLVHIAHTTIPSQAVFAPIPRHCLHLHLPLRQPTFAVLHCSRPRVRESRRPRPSQTPRPQLLLDRLASFGRVGKWTSHGLHRLAPGPCFRGWCLRRKSRGSNPMKKGRRKMDEGGREGRTPTEGRRGRE